MKTNKVKEMLRAGEVTFGTWLSLGDLYTARLLARSGFDWLTLDMEHSPIDWQQAAAVVAAVADAGCVPLIRVPRGEHYLIKRALDAGAYGIVVPMVETLEQARAAIAAAKYPPEGNRSAGGGWHTLNFETSSEEYFRRANEEILVVLQTESPRGVENAPEIYALRGCDAVFVGPVDLRFTMRKPDGAMPSMHAHRAMIERVITIGKRVGCPTGIHAMDPHEAIEWGKAGMQFIAVGSDVRMLYTRACEWVGWLRPDSPSSHRVQY
ncbi:4-hydroxy-2-oxoheptanedioate aldolase [Thermostilla marina]